MQLQGNTILITGGGSGIGLALAQAFHEEGNAVILAGRRRSVLEWAAAAHPGMDWIELDVTRAESVADAAAQLVARHPALNVVINNAGVQRVHDFALETPLDEAAAAAEIDTNIWGVLRVTGALLPQLKQQAKMHANGATLINVTSGIAFVPMARFPVYCATKAFIHSYTLSLRAQLKPSGVRVVELAPPWVKTELDAAQPDRPIPEGRGPMPLAEFTTAAMAELAGDGDELPVAFAKYLRSAAVSDQFATVFDRINH